MAKELYRYNHAGIVTEVEGFDTSEKSLMNKIRNAQNDTDRIFWVRELKGRYGKVYKPETAKK